MGSASGLDGWGAGGPRMVDQVSGTASPFDVLRWRGDSGRPLLLSPGPGISRADLDPGTRGVWRYRAALPLDIAAPIELGAGGTPLLRAERAGVDLRCKLEWFSPTGSFKDRGTAVMLSALGQRGVREVIEDSSGNAGASIAGYGAAAGLAVTVFAPASTSPAKLAQSRAYGARVELVEGPREAAQEAAIRAANATGAAYASHNWHPLFIEGVKLLAYEIWEDLGFRAPDHIVMPVGAGSLLLGLSRGFEELRRSGQIERMPRLHAVQPLHCSPVDAAFRNASGDDAHPAPASESARPVLPTLAEGTAIRDPLRLPEMLAALAASGGTTTAVPEAEIRPAQARLARRGLFVEPTSATVEAAVERLIGEGVIRPGSCAVVVLTGSGLKAAAPVREAGGEAGGPSLPGG